MAGCVCLQLDDRDQGTRKKFSRCVGKGIHLSDSKVPAGGGDMLVFVLGRYTVLWG